MKVWDLNEGRCLRTLETWRLRHIHSVLAFTDRVIYGGYIRSGIWDLTACECIHQNAMHDGYITCIRLLPDGHVVSSCVSRIVIWDPTTGRTLQTLRGHSSRVSSVAILEDGRFVSSSRDCTLKIWHDYKRTFNKLLAEDIARRWGDCEDISKVISSFLFQAQ